MTLAKTEPKTQQLQAPSPQLATQSQPPSKASTARRNLTYQEKLQIIEKKDREPSWTQENLALWAKDTFKMNTRPTQATISNILRCRDKLQTTNVPPDFRSARPVKHPDLDLAVIRWVLQQVESNSPLTRDAIQQRAAALADEMNISTDIRFSKGWVSSFIKRHQLQFNKRHGGSGHGDTVSVDPGAIRQRLAQPAVVPAEAPAAAVADVRAIVATPAPAPTSSAASSNGSKRKRSSGPETKSVVQQQQPTVPQYKQAPSVPQQQQRLVKQQQQQTQQLQAQVQRQQLQRAQQSPPSVIAPQQPPVASPPAAPQQPHLQSQPQSQSQLPPPPPKKPRNNRLSIELTPDKERQQQLFDLECQKLQVDIEAKQVQLMVEKTLARKKLLDAGIPEAEVNKLFPM